MRLLTVILMLFTVSLGAAELSSSAERAVERFKEDLTEAVEEFEEAKRDALADLTRVLERERERSERRGETEVVALIDEQLAAAQTELETAGQVTDLLGQPATIHSVNARQAQAIVRSLDKLTVEQWEAAPGLELVVDASKPLDTGIIVNPGESYIIVPHPTDTWRTWTNDILPLDAQVDHNGISIEQRWHGKNAAGTHPRDWGRGLMSYRIGSAETYPLHLTTVVSSPIATSQVDDPQPLWIMTHHPDRNNDVGTIRVKILRIE